MFIVYSFNLQCFLFSFSPLVSQEAYCADIYFIGGQGLVKKSCNDLVFFMKNEEPCLTFLDGVF